MDELFEKLEDKNALVKMPVFNIRNCIYMSAVMACIIPVLYLYNALVNKAGFLTATGLVLIFAEILNLVFLLVNYSVKNASEIKGRFKSTFKVYIAFLNFFMYSLALFNISDSIGIIYYSILLITMAVVPVFSRKQFYGFKIFQGFAMASLICERWGDMNDILAIVLVNVACIAVEFVRYDLVAKNLMLEKQLSEQTRLSEKDQLTKLANRRGLERKVEVAWPMCARHGIATGIIMLDVDFFKAYNDTYGHPQGDECLKEIAKSLKATARRSTDVVSRIGGEEFLIFVQDIQRSDLLLLAKRIQRNIENLGIEHATKQISQYVTVSIGTAFAHPSDGITFEDMYEMADKALYLAKINGRNCIAIDGNVLTRSKKAENHTDRLSDQADIYMAREAR